MDEPMTVTAEDLLHARSVSKHYKLTELSQWLCEAGTTSTSTKHVEENKAEVN